MNRDFLQFMQAGGYQNRSLWSDEAWKWKNEAEDCSTRHSGGAKEVCGCIARCLANPVAAGLAGVCEPRGSDGLREVARAKLPKRRAISSRGVRHVGRRRRARLSVGNEAPSEKYGNFDFQHWDPSPVGAYPRGASAFGVHDIVGNGWEWTRRCSSRFPDSSRCRFIRDIRLIFLTASTT